MTPEQEAIKKELSPKQRGKNKAKNWLTPEGLALLEGLSRDGYGLGDIANRMGITLTMLRRWRIQYEAIDVALRQGREIADYMVENALFKSALGYRTKEVSIQTKMENGAITEIVKDVKFRDQNPNIRAIEIWLYNRKPDLWKRDGGSRLDELIEDSSIQITVNRGNPDKEDKENKWQEEVNDNITINKKSNKPSNNKTKKQANKQTNNIDIELNKENRNGNKSNFDEYNKQLAIKKTLPSDNINVDREQSLSAAFKEINDINHYHTGKNSQETNNKPSDNDLDEWPDNWEELIDISDESRN